MLKTGKIVGYVLHNFRNTLENAMIEGISDDGYKYGLIRVSGFKNDGEKKVKGVKTPTKMSSVDDLQIMRQIYELAIKLGWVVKQCDSSCKSNINMSDLVDAPQDANTIVVIKGKCRMGEVVAKTHLAFGVETSVNANTDTMLQSILGRLCGHNPNRSVKIYIPDKITKSGELQRYLKFIHNLRQQEEITCLPKKAKNIAKETTQINRKRISTIPIKVEGIDFTHIYRDTMGKNDKKNTGALIQNIVNAFRENSHLENFNSLEDFEKIRSKVKLADDQKQNKNIDPDNKIIVRRIYKKSNDSYKRAIPILRTMLDTKVVRPLGTPLGVTILIFSDSFTEYGFAKNDIYVDCPFLDDNVNTGRTHGEVPKTTKREIFSHTLSTNEEIFVNGALLLGLHPDTLHDIDMMKRALSNVISHSINLSESETDGLVYHRRINSVVNQTSENAGIWIIPEIYEALQVGGTIYQDLLAEFGVSLSLIRDPKPQTSIDVIELVKLLEISW